MIVFIKISDSRSSVAEDLILLECDNVSFAV
jgi:hypothetical protein